MTKAGRLICFDGATNEIQIGCNIHQLPQLVNANFPAKHGLLQHGFVKMMCSVFHPLPYLCNGELPGIPIAKPTPSPHWDICDQGIGQSDSA
ncbi:MAG TPA: hypothetical protein VLJ79_07690 [Candidatus Binatia bacterium]|nr:hypothetical protein [Candidatus Binatia bacterium]